MASSLIAMAFNLVAMAGLQPASDGLQPNSDGLQATSDGLQPSSDGLQPSSNGLPPTYYTSDGLQPNSDGLQPTSDGLQPSSDGLQPTNDGLIPRNWFLPPLAASPKYQCFRPVNPSINPPLVRWRSPPAPPSTAPSASRDAKTQDVRKKRNPRCVQRCPRGDVASNGAQNNK